MLPAMSLLNMADRRLFVRSEITAWDLVLYFHSSQPNVYINSHFYRQKYFLIAY